MDNLQHDGQNYNARFLLHGKHEPDGRRTRFEPSGRLWVIEDLEDKGSNY